MLSGLEIRRERISGYVNRLNLKLRGLMPGFDKLSVF